MRKELLLAASAFVVSVAGSSVAQAQCVLKGTVIDAATNDPLVGVTVSLQGTPTKVFTDNDGKFVIKSPKTKCNLQFSSVGFESTTLASNHAGEYDFGFIPMASASIALKDAVVTTRAVARKTPVALPPSAPSPLRNASAQPTCPRCSKPRPAYILCAKAVGYGDTKVNMRGFKSENVAVLVNGVSMNDRSGVVCTGPTGPAHRCGFEHPNPARFGRSQGVDALSRRIDQHRHQDYRRPQGRCFHLRLG